MHRLFSDLNQGRWRFYSDTKIIGTKTIKQAKDCLRQVLETEGFRKCIILTDQGVSKTDFFRRFAKDMKSDIHILGVECDIGPMQEAVDAIRKDNIEAIIAVGGGSVLDAAKVIAAAIDNTDDFFELSKLHELKSPALPLICIPTTFGTGSEVNMYGHVRVGNKKLGIRRAWLAPKFAILIGEAALGLSKKMRYLTGLDAWTHVYETLINCYETNPFNRALLKDALSRHATCFQSYVDKPTVENCLDMATISAMAGLAINNGRTGIMHTLAVPFAAKTGFGHALSLLPFIKPAIRFNYNFLDKDLSLKKSNFLTNVEKQLLFMAPSFMNEWDMTFTQNDIDEMTALALSDTVLVKENPRQISANDIKLIYNESLEKFIA